MNENIESIGNAVSIAGNLCSWKLREGHVAVDATLGNGNDTELLCRLVGETGHVYGFDVQEVPIVNTRNRLDSAGILHRATLILAGHEEMDSHLRGIAGIRLVLFNLGYLPGFKDSTRTEADTTLKAVEKALDLIEPGGVVVIVIYPGHPEGSLEERALESYLSGLNQKEYTVARLSFINQINNPPGLLCIEKLK